MATKRRSSAKNRRRDKAIGEYSLSKTKRKPSKKSRSEAAKKAARTRKRNAAKRSAAAKKGARTRKRNARKRRR